MMRLTLMTRDYLICYDIGDTKRLGRVHRLLSRQAMAVQYSVFVFTGSEARLALCLKALEGLIDARADDLRAYPLPARGRRLLIGPGPLPEGVFWAGLAQPWRHESEAGLGAANAHAGGGALAAFSGNTVRGQAHGEHVRGLAAPWAMPLEAVHTGGGSGAEGV